MALALPVLGPVIVGAALGRLTAGVGAGTGAGIGLRVGLAGLAALVLFVALGAALGVGLPWSVNFHGVDDAWRVVTHPFGWITLVSAAVTAFMTWGKRNRRS